MNKITTAMLLASFAIVVGLITFGVPDATVALLS